MLLSQLCKLLHALFPSGGVQTQILEYDNGCVSENMFTWKIFVWAKSSRVFPCLLWLFVHVVAKLKHHKRHNELVNILSSA